MIKAIEEGKKWIKEQGLDDMIVGFDMVNEEDYNHGIDHFLESIIEAKERLGEDFQVIFHAGESYSRHNTEVFDAILLGSKRLGHGFNILQYPNLIEMVKEKDICIECCPISNRVIGYCTDLRLHPTRTLLKHGVKVSISPDD